MGARTLYWNIFPMSYLINKHSLYWHSDSDMRKAHSREILKSVTSRFDDTGTDFTHHYLEFNTCHFKYFIFYTLALKKINTVNISLTLVWKNRDIKLNHNWNVCFLNFHILYLIRGSVVDQISSVSESLRFGTEVPHTC